mmetsp:Transcript_96875/g.141713  ORF Transcript_96875/g.141713 Transcript_96875/m.141713 type:complete len:86 (-) Transcript_96875:170-427(-)
MQHTATQYAATHCNNDTILVSSFVTHCINNAELYNTPQLNALKHTSTKCSIYVTLYNTLQPNTQQHTATTRSVYLKFYEHCNATH